MTFRALFILIICIVLVACNKQDNTNSGFISEIDIIDVETNNAVNTLSIGQEVALALTVTNDSNANQKLTFNSTQTSKFEIINVETNQSWEIGYDHFGLVITHLVFGKNESKRFEYHFIIGEQKSNPLNVGEYILKGSLKDNTDPVEMFFSVTE